MPTSCALNFGWLRQNVHSFSLINAFTVQFHSNSIRICLPLMSIPSYSLELMTSSVISDDQFYRTPE